MLPVTVALGATIYGLNISMELCGVTGRGRISSVGPWGTAGIYCPERKMSERLQAAPLALAPRRLSANPASPADPKAAQPEFLLKL